MCKFYLFTLRIESVVYKSVKLDFCVLSGRYPGKLFDPRSIYLYIIFILIETYISLITSFIIKLFESSLNQSYDFRH